MATFPVPSIHSLGTEVSLPDLIPEDTAAESIEEAVAASASGLGEEASPPPPSSPNYKYCNDAFRKLNERKQGGGISTIFSSSSAPAGAKEPAAFAAAAADAAATADSESATTAFEHDLEPGDHVYRWSHFAYSYPIQIHGIVLSTEGGGGGKKKSKRNEGGDAENDEEKEGKKTMGRGEVEKGQDGEGEEKKKDDEDAGEESNENDDSSSSSSSSSSSDNEGGPIVVTIADFGFTRKGGDDESDNGESERTTGSDDGNDAVDGTAGVNAADAAVEGTAAATDDGAKATSKDGNNKKRQAPMSKHESFVSMLKAKDGRRLNVITLTDEKDIKKWKKVNWGESLFSSGGGGGKKKTKKWASWFKGGAGPSAPSVSGRCGSNAVKVCDDATVDVEVTKVGIAVEETETEAKKDGPSASAEASTVGDGGGSSGCGSSLDEAKAKCKGKGSEDGQQQQFSEKGSEALSGSGCDVDLSHSSATSSEPAANGNKRRPQSPNERQPKSPSARPEPWPIEATPVDLIPMEEGTEAKTLEEMIAAANAVERRARTSPRKSSGGRAQSPHQKNPFSVQQAAGIRKSGSLVNIWPWKGRGGSDLAAASDSDDAALRKGGNNNGGDASASASAPASVSAAAAASASEAADHTKQDGEKQPPAKLPRSDPAGIVLARVNFLLEHEEDGILPPYHVFNSNSECIAVWCKTGKWSSLQSDVFLHTTGIGNAKSSTLVGLSVAAAQPWLIPAIPIAAVAAVGAPYLVLHQAKKKGEEATQNLNDGFWAWAGPEVYVEAIQNWSGLRLCDS